MISTPHSGGGYLLVLFGGFYTLKFKPEAQETSNRV